MSPDRAFENTSLSTETASAKLKEPRGVLAWFATNHVAANLLMLSLLVIGGYSALNTKVNVFPDLDPRTISVGVFYPGATPEEVEEGISRRVEEALAGIEGIKRVRATSSENIGSVTVELTDDADKSDVLDDVKSAVDGIQNFPPQDAENPTVQDSVIKRKVLTVALWGKASERSLRELAFRLRDDLSSLKGISMVKVQGVRDYEIGVEVSEESLRRHGLSIEHVTNAVRGYSVNLPAGAIRTERGEILLRTDSQAYDRIDFERLVVLSGNDGTIVRLGDVALIRDGFEDVETASRFNSNPVAYVTVSSVGNQQVLDIEQKVKTYLAGWPTPEGVQATVWSNGATVLRSRMDLLLRNGGMGLILVFAVLVLFLELRLAFWTTMGIPISFLGAFLLIPLVGGSINMISLFGFILVLGIVVDDAIVVGENIFAKREAGLPPKQAAIEGLREVISPVSMGVVTTILAFLPLYFTTGFFGDILWVVPVVVISVLLMSLVESFLILPAHLSGARVKRKRGTLVLIQDTLRSGLQWIIDRIYRPLLRKAVDYRYVTMASAVAVTALTVGLVKGGFVDVKIFPPIEGDNITARLNMVGGTPASETKLVLQHLLNTMDEVRAEFDAKTPDSEASIVRNVAGTLGDQPFGGGRPHASTSASGSNVAEVAIELSPGEERSIATSTIVERWRELIGEVPSVNTLTLNSNMLSAGDDVNVELAHSDFPKLLTATGKLKEFLGQYNGVHEIADSFEAGKRELNFELTRVGIAAGLTRSDLARQVRQSYYGAEAQRVQRGRDDVKVLVRYTEQERRNLSSLEELRIRLPNGSQLPLATVATYSEQRGYAVLTRTDRKRIVRVSADINEEAASVADINEQLKEVFLPGLIQEIPGLSFSFEGAERERMESMQSLARGMAIAIFAIFALLAVQLKSYTQPLIIMAIIPLGVIGAVIGHMLLGYSLSFFSMFGVVALSGVVINDSLVMLDLINRLVREGMTMEEAVMQAGPRRFRAILFTSLTTFVGLAPIVMETSMQAQFLIPMAISLSGGVAFATCLTLLLIPALVMFREDVFRLRAWVASHLIPVPEEEPESISS
ncbi:MAG: efflux RND transporter permease subunit [bacterium]|nr:efflux RND transporter permease subunit [bacterium]